MKNHPNRRPHPAYHTRPAAPPPTMVPTAPAPPPTAPTPRSTWVSLVDAGLRVTAAVLNFIATFGGHH